MKKKQSNILTFVLFYNLLFAGLAVVNANTQIVNYPEDLAGTFILKNINNGQVLLVAANGIPGGPVEMWDGADDETTSQYNGQDQWKLISSKVFMYDAITGLSHNIGRAEDDGWSANTESDNPGFLIYGPYASDWGSEEVSVDFQMMSDNVNGNNDIVATLDIHDYTEFDIVATKNIYRYDFNNPNIFQSFNLKASLAGREGHLMESRIYWYDQAYIKVRNVIVNYPEDPAGTLHQAVLKYAPRIYMADSEEWFPTSVSNFSGICYSQWLQISD